jgi:hypothetical protein
MVVMLVFEEGPRESYSNAKYLYFFSRAKVNIIKCNQLNCSDSVTTISILLKMSAYHTNTRQRQSASWKTSKGKEGWHNTNVGKDNVDAMKQILEQKNPDKLIAGMNISGMLSLNNYPSFSKNL